MTHLPNEDKPPQHFQDHRFVKSSCIFYEQKLQETFFPFLGKVVDQIIEVYLETEEKENYEKLLILREGFSKISQIIDTNKERMDILGSDFVTESENEDEIRSCFSKEALEIFD